MRSQMRESVRESQLGEESGNRVQESRSIHMNAMIDVMTDGYIPPRAKHGVTAIIRYHDIVSAILSYHLHVPFNTTPIDLSTSLSVGVAGCAGAEGKLRHGVSLNPLLIY